jgi:hypothetical protein
MKKGDTWFLLFSVVFVLGSFYQKKHKLPHMIKSVTEWNKKDVYDRKVQPNKKKKKSQTKKTDRKQEKYQKKT